MIKSMKGTATAVTVTTLLIPLWSCSSPGFAAKRLGPDHDTVRICETRATQTRCYRQDLAEFFEESEAHRELLELSDG